MTFLGDLQTNVWLPSQTFKWNCLGSRSTAWVSLKNRNSSLVLDSIFRLFVWFHGHVHFKLPPWVSDTHKHLIDDCRLSQTIYILTVFNELVEYGGNRLYISLLWGLSKHKTHHGKCDTSRSVVGKMYWNVLMIWIENFSIYQKAEDTF